MSPARPHRLQRWLCVYHLQPWHRKVAGARLLWYAVLGYAIAGRWHVGLIALNTLALLGLVMFQAALNDYWDYRLARECNVLGALLRSRRLTRQQAAWAIGVPLGLTLPMLASARDLGCSWLIPALLLIGAGLAVIYAAPPLRLKTWRPWGVLMAPLLTTLMFLEAHLTLASLTPPAIGLAIVLWQFQLYAELLHVVAMSPRSAVKYAPAAALRQLPWLAAGGVVLSLCLALAHPVFWISVAGSTMRFQAMRAASLRRRITQGRTRLLGRVLGVYEFAAYGGLGLVHAWRL